MMVFKRPERVPADTWFQSRGRTLQHEQPAPWLLLYEAQAGAGTGVTGMFY